MICVTCGKVIDCTKGECYVDEKETMVGWIQCKECYERDKK